MGVRLDEQKLAHSHEGLLDMRGFDLHHRIRHYGEAERLTNLVLVGTRAAEGVLGDGLLSHCNVAIVCWAGAGVWQDQCCWARQPSRRSAQTMKS